MKVYTVSDKCLRTESLQYIEKEWTNGGVLKESQKLQDLWNHLGCIPGVALPQAGVNKSMILCRIKKLPVVMINPVITKKSKVQLNSNEGCHSVKGRYIVKRSIWLVVVYQDLLGKKCKSFYLWKYARIVQHEVNHLQGITIDKIGIRWKYNNIYNKRKKGGT